MSPTRTRSFAFPVDFKLANLSDDAARSVAHPWAMTGCRPSSLLNLSIMLSNSPWRIWCRPNLQNMNESSPNVNIEGTTKDLKQRELETYVGSIGVSRSFGPQQIASIKSRENVIAI